MPSDRGRKSRDLPEAASNSSERRFPAPLRLIFAGLNINRSAVILGTRATITKGRSSKAYWNDEARSFQGAWLAVDGPLFLGMILLTVIATFLLAAPAALLSPGPFREWVIYWIAITPLSAGACGLIESRFRADNKRAHRRVARSRTPLWDVDLVNNSSFLLASSFVGYLVAAAVAQVLALLLSSTAPN